MTALLADLLADPDAFSTAACIGSHHLFDTRREREPEAALTARHQQAVGICITCLCQDACGALLGTLRPSRRMGVWAGLSCDVPDLDPRGTTTTHDHRGRGAFNHER